MMRGGSVAMVGLGLVLAGCPGDVVPGAGVGEGSSTGTGPGITTFNSTIDPTLPGEGTMETAGETGGTTVGESAGTTMGMLDGTTLDPGTTSSTTDPGTTSSTTDPGTTSSTTDPSTTSSTTDPGTTDPSTTSSTTDPSTSSTGDPTTGGGCNSVPGNYESCLDMAGAIDNTPCMAPGAATCIYTGALPSPTGGVCSIQDCVDACDCPAAPPTGNSVVTCDELTGVAGDLFCYLDCGMGETCPTGTTCFGGFLCIWPGPGAMGVPYGDCFNDPDICGFDGICLNDGAMPTIGVCTNECAVVGDCAAAPPGGTSPVDCTDVTADGAPECIIDCSGGTSCPAGMTCFGGFICAWN